MITPILYVILSFVPVGILSLAFEIWHQLRSGGARQPVKDKLLRPPGESCRWKMEQLNEKIIEVGIWILGFPPTLLICYLSSTGTGAASRPISGVWISAFAVAAAALAVFVWNWIGLVRERNNWRLAFSAERAVGEQLNQLMSEGCRVFHDFPLVGQGNIDHIVVAPSGVHAIETRARRKGNASATRQAHEVMYDGQALEFPFHCDTRDLAQARVQAAQLAQILGDTLHLPILVQPILTLPGWYVIVRGVGDVIVVNPTKLDSVILTHAAPVLTAAQIQDIARVLEQKCRDVEF